ncbi:MAG: methyltransferase domain-containing protein [Chloroflexi bacterium]|nr:methyltransferase domain-containing protein [Chloroflexota bacterium]
MARKELNRYLKKGLDRRTRLLVDFLRSQDISGATILEIGFGTGSLHMELLKAGAARATGYEVSPAYVEAATSLAERLGFRDRVAYSIGDFVQITGQVNVADVVALDRVVCCYPDMLGLVASTAKRARRLYALTYPRTSWWMRIFRVLGNLALAVLRHRYRIFLHAPRDITATIEAAGLALAYHRTSGIWHIAVFSRPQPAPGVT